MCGIAGIINFTGQSPTENLLTQMTDVIEHRGPDGSGVYISDGVAFGHRRLSIIDFAGGHQPMITVDDRVTITYNGEGKYIFKKSLEKDLPLDILYRPKMGFRVPLQSWFRNELKEKNKSAVLSERMLDSDHFDQGYHTTLINEHQAGFRDHSAPLWTLIMYDQFLIRHA